MKKLSQLALSLCISLLIIITACSEDNVSTEYTLKNEDGNKYNIVLDLWTGVHPDDGSYSGERCTFGTRRMNFNTDDYETITFKYLKKSSRVLPNGNWINEVEVQVIESETDLLSVGTKCYVSLYLFSTNDFISMCIDTSLPYKMEGHVYPSSNFPLVRQFEAY